MSKNTSETTSHTTGRVSKRRVRICFMLAFHDNSGRCSVFSDQGSHRGLPGSTPRSVPHGNRVQGGLEGAHIFFSEEKPSEPSMQHVPLGAAVVSRASDLGAQRSVHLANPGAQRDVAYVRDPNAAARHDADAIPRLAL